MTILQSAWRLLQVSVQRLNDRVSGVTALGKLARILSLTTSYLIPASCSTTMSIKHAIRPVRKPIKPHTTQRLISRQRKFWNKRQGKKGKKERADNSYKGSHMQSLLMCFVQVNSHIIYHVTHPPLLFQKQLVLDVIIVQTLEEYTKTNISLYSHWNFKGKINLHRVNSDNNDFIDHCHFPTCIRLLPKIPPIKFKHCLWLHIRQESLKYAITQFKKKLYWPHIEMSTYWNVTLAFNPFTWPRRATLARRSRRTQRLYLVFEWQQLFIVRNLFRPPSERLLQENTVPKKHPSPHDHSFMTSDLFNHVTRQLTSEQ